MIRVLLSIELVLCLVTSHVLTMEDESIRAYFSCNPCAEQQCPETPTDCAEYVKGPGVCNCCTTCAILEGDNCGVGTARCRQGLECTPPSKDGPRATWISFLMDKGVCRPRGKLASHWSAQAFLVPPVQKTISHTWVLAMSSSNPNFREC